MSHVITGHIIFSLFASRFFKTVTVSFVGECETSTNRTKVKDFYAKVKLPTRWRAKLFAARINKQQFRRYNGTPYDIHRK